MKKLKNFPHESDNLVNILNHTIEDDIKLKAELGNTTPSNPKEGWETYKNMVYWVTFCDRVKITIGNREEVYQRMEKLWKYVRASDLYKGKK